jgi:hypothetical protein
MTLGDLFAQGEAARAAGMSPAEIYVWALVKDTGIASHRSREILRRWMLLCICANGGAAPDEQKFAAAVERLRARDRVPIRRGEYLDQALLDQFARRARKAPEPRRRPERAGRTARIVVHGRIRRSAAASRDGPLPSSDDESDPPPLGGPLADNRGAA